MPTLVYWSRDLIFNYSLIEKTARWCCIGAWPQTGYCTIPVKQVSWESFILLIKTAPILLLCNWIFGGQEHLDGPPWGLFWLNMLFWASFVNHYFKNSLFSLSRLTHPLSHGSWSCGGHSWARLGFQIVRKTSLIVIYFIPFWFTIINDL